MMLKGFSNPLLLKFDLIIHGTGATSLHQYYTGGLADLELKLLCSMPSALGAVTSIPPWHFTALQLQVSPNPELYGVVTIGHPHSKSSEVCQSVAGFPSAQWEPTQLFSSVHLLKAFFGNSSATSRTAD